MKLKHLFALMAFALVGNASAKEDVTSKLNDAALANESNWALVSNGGNHTVAQNGYHESWHNTFTLTQTVKDLPAGYYRLSIQAVVENNFSNTISLTATSGSNSSVAAHPVYTCYDSYANMAAWWKADADALGNANLNRIYTTVKVEEGEDLVCRFEQTANDQWMVYGQFKLEKLTDAEGENAQAFEAVYNNKTELQNIASGRFKQRFESYDDHKEVDGERLTKTISGLPNGKYNITINGSASYTSGRGFEGATGDNLVVFFANDKTTNVPVVDRTNVGNGEFGDYTIEGALVTDGNLKFGYRRLALGANWFTASVKSIEYLGVDLSDYEEPFNTALANAKAIQSANMNSDVKAALNTAVTNNDVEFSTFTKAEDVEAAINALNTATGDANTSIANYEAVKAVIDAQAAIVANYDAAGKAAYDIAAVQAAYDNGIITDGAAEIATLKAAIQTAVRAQGVGADYTAALANPDFKTNDLTGWNMNGKVEPAVDVANHNCEFYEKTFDMSQTVSNLKKGTYEISFQAFQRPGAANNDLATNFVNDNWTSCATLYTTAQETAVKHICEDWSETELFNDNSWHNDSQVTPEGGSLHYIPNSQPGGRAYFDAGKYITTAKAVVLEDGGSLTFGFRGEQPTSSWILFDNFTLTYIDAEVMIDEAESDKVITTANTLESEKMSATVKTALTNAKNTLSDDKTNGAKYNTLKEAIATAEASAEKYATMNHAMTSWFAEKTFADEKASYATTYAAQLSAFDAAYNNGTVEDANVQTTINGLRNDYRVYVKALAANYPIVEGIKDVRSEEWTNISGAQNKNYFDNPINNDIAANTMFENWRQAGLNGDLKLNVSGLPNGQYFLYLASFTRNSINDNDYIYIKSGENTAKAVSTGESASSAGLVNITDPIEIINGEVEIGIHVGSGADWAAIADARLYAYEIEDYARLTDTDGYGTICLPYAATVKGATVYSAAIEGEAVKLTEVGTELAAGIPYVYKATADAQTFTYTSGNLVADPVAAGPLVGAFTLTEVAANGTNYMLQYHDGYAFYQVTEDAHIGANRCYLTAPAGTEIKALVLDTEADAIQNIEIAEGNGAIYDLSGRKVSKAQKGLYIVNGKKIVK